MIHLRSRSARGRRAGRADGFVSSPATSLHILAAVLTAGLVAAAFFSMFGKNWDGPWDSILAYANYFHRGSQQGEHSEPWYYYLQLLFAFGLRNGSSGARVLLPCWH